MNQKVIKAINGAGAAGIVCGIITIISGVSAGVVMIANAGRLLASKKYLEP